MEMEMGSRLVSSAPQLTVDERLARLEEIVQHLMTRRDPKQWYTTEEFAEIVDKAEFTVREWCRLRRIHADKRKSGRGKHDAWVISHDELLRYQREGLLPVS